MTVRHQRAAGKVSVQKKENKRQARQLEQSYKGLRGVELDQAHEIYSTLIALESSQFNGVPSICNSMAKLATNQVGTTVWTKLAKIATILKDSNPLSWPKSFTYPDGTVLGPYSNQEDAIVGIKGHSPLHSEGA